MYKEMAALILEGKYDEVVKDLKIQIENQLPPHQKNIMATLLRKLSEHLIQAEKAEEMIGGWRIQCFNNIKMTRHGTEIQNIRWKRKKAEELFIFLLLQPNYCASKDTTAEKLFYCDDAGQISNQLYVIIHHIKRTLHDYLNIDKGITIKNGMIQLHEEMIDYIDTEKYSTLVRVGNQLWATYPDLSIDLFDEARQLYGELAPSLQYLDWIDEYRKELLLKQTGILKRLATYYIIQENLERAEYYYLEWISLAPYEEEVYQELMKLYIKMNKTSTAKLWFRKMEQLFHTELGIVPTNETMNIISESL